MRYYWSILLIVLALFASCGDGRKEFTITGVFDLPELIQVGDTLIERGPLDGYEVYLLDIANHEVIDSALIVNETFTISGKVHPDSAYFATVICQWGVGLVVIEPGEIEVELTAAGVTPRGTAMNEDIVDLEAGLENMREDFYEFFQEMVNSGTGEQTTEMMSLYEKEQQAMLAFIDSVYEANPNNLVGVYAASLLLEQYETLDEYDAALEGYSDYVKNSQLVQAYREYIQERGEWGGIDPEAFDFDPIMPE